MFDIVFPENNENEFIAIAEKLGFKGLVFAYEKSSNFKALDKFNSKLRLFNAILAPAKKVRSARGSAELIISRAEEDSRDIIEKQKPDVVFEFESGQTKDFMHQRSSGLNHILCRLAKKNDVMIGFSFSCVLSAPPVSRSQIIGRMMQNIMLCRKFKVPILIASFAEKPFEMRSSHDLISFFTALGMHPKEARDSLNSVFDKINRNARKTKGHVNGMEFAD